MVDQLLRRFAQNLVLAPQRPNFTVPAAQVLAKLGETGNKITTA